MSIVIGGTPSSGSSLLSVLLNRHSDIHIEQESHILSKKGLYQNWNKNKKAIASDGYTYLPSPGWHMLNGVIMPDNDLLRKAKLIQTVNDSNSFESFLSSYIENKLLQHSKQIWGEKTPSNIYFFHEIDRILPELTFICTIRNPYDIIASLINRGLTSYSAFGLCLTQLFMAYHQQQSMEVYLVTYEDLVQDPELVMKSLFLHIDVTVENVRENPTSQTKIKGWKYYEDGEIGTQSINRFHSLASEIKEDILSLADQLMVNPRFISQFNLESGIDISKMNIRSLANHFGYENPISHSKSKYHYQMEYAKDRVKRLLKLHPTFIQYPIIRIP